MPTTGKPIEQRRPKLGGFYLKNAEHPRATRSLHDVRLLRGCAMSSLILVLCAVSVPAHARATITRFFVGTAVTLPFAINKNGDIAGTYHDSDGEEGGFLRDGTTGGLTRFSVGGHPTNAVGIDDVGVIIGTWKDSTGNGHCYWRNPIDTRKKPCGPAGAESTTAVAISKFGVAGTFLNPGDDNDHGFIDDLEGNVVTFDAPGATDTGVGDINDNGDVVGSWTNADGGFHGYIRDPSGNSTEFDIPNSLNTFASRINNAGTIIGDFVDTNFVQHCFVLSANLATFTPSGAQTCASVGINKRGAIAGQWTDDLGLQQGYERTANGILKTLNVPRASQTLPEAINDAGVITGGIESSKCNGPSSCAFIRTP